MFDPISITIIGALAKGTVGYIQEEQRKERIRLERKEAIKEELACVGGKAFLMLLNAGPQALENRANNPRQITQGSESTQ